VSIRRPYTRNGRSPYEIFPPEQPCQTEFNRGELRLVAEVTMAWLRGEEPPIEATAKALVAVYGMAH
jgi:hypothetical protein